MFFPGPAHVPIGEPFALSPRRLGGDDRRVRSHRDGGCEPCQGFLYTAFDLSGRKPAQGMRDDQQGQFRHAELFGLDLAHGREDIGADHGCRHASVL